MHRSLILIILLSVFLPLALAGCVEEEAEPIVIRDQPLTFPTIIDVKNDQEVVIDLAVYSGSGPLPAEETFNGRWELSGADGEPRAAADVHEIDSVPGGQQKVIFSWSGQLIPGRYEMTWGAPAYGGTVVEFAVVEAADGTIRLGDQVDIYNSTSYPPSK